MKCTKPEITHAQEVRSEVAEAKLLELTDLQLAFVGGGIVDGVPH